MKILALGIVALLSTNSLVAQEEKSEKNVDVKVEKTISTNDGNRHEKTKIIVMKDNKIVFNEEGPNITMKEALKKAGISKDEIDRISMTVDSDNNFIHKNGHGNMMWISDGGEDVEVVAISERGMPRNHKKHSFNRSMPMMFNDGSVSIFDYSKSDKDTKEFDAKQGKKIDFKSLEISAVGKMVKLSFKSEKAPLEVSVKSAKGNKLYYKMDGDFEGVFQGKIPVMSAGKGTYILEVKVGKRNWLQKIVVE